MVSCCPHEVMRAHEVEGIARGMVVVICRGVAKLRWVRRAQIGPVRDHGKGMVGSRAVGQHTVVLRGAQQGDQGIKAQAAVGGHGEGKWGGGRGREGVVDRGAASRKGIGEQDINCGATAEAILGKRQLPAEVLATEKKALKGGGEATRVFDAVPQVIK